jgi:hypothetical protein
MTRSKMNIVLPFPCNTHQLFVTSGAAFFVYLFTLIPRHCSHCHHHRFWVFFHCRNEKIWQHMPKQHISTGDVEHLIHQVFLSSNTWFTGFSFFLGRVSSLGCWSPFSTMQAQVWWWPPSIWEVFFKTMVAVPLFEICWTDHILIWSRQTCKSFQTCWYAAHDKILHSF